MNSVNIGFVIVNLIIFGLNLKLYTEWWKERIKDKPKEAADE